MGINKTIKSRRSIRQYKSKKVPEELLKKILDSARWAPSLHNLQPWKFIIPRGKMKKKLIKIVKSRQGFEPLIIRLPLKRNIEVMENAPVTILAYNNGVVSNKAKKAGKFFYNTVNMCEIQSVACSIQNMLLTAHSLGLGALWIAMPLIREKHINRVLGVKDRLMAIVTVGYPAENPDPPTRKPLSEIVSFRE